MAVEDTFNGAKTGLTLLDLSTAPGADGSHEPKSISVPRHTVSAKFTEAAGIPSPHVAYPFRSRSISANTPFRFGGWYMAGLIFHSLPYPAIATSLFWR